MKMKKSVSSGVIPGMCKYFICSDSSNRICSRQKGSCDLGLFRNRCTETDDAVIN